jgi:acyl carrier protein
MSELLSKVKEIISDKLMLDADEVSEASSFVDDLGADSLDTVELIMAFEDEFDIEISDEDAEKISTVGEAIAYLEEILSAKQE